MRKFTFMAIMVLMAVFAFGQKSENGVRRVGSPVGISAVQADRMQALLGQEITGVANGDDVIDRMKQLVRVSPFQKAVGNNKMRKVSGMPAADGMITSQPEGEMKSYVRSGMCYASGDFITYEKTAQFGYLDVVYAPDGKTVYLKDFISALTGYGIWVKGSLSDDGKRISVPTGQCVLDMNDLGRITMEVVAYQEAENRFVVDEAAKEVVLTVDGDVLTVENTSEHRVVGMVFADSREWACFGDYESVYTLFDFQPVTPPADLPAVKYILHATDGYESPVHSAADMVFDGNDVYIKGLGGYYCPTAWVKGIKDGEQITIPSGQYLGKFEDEYLMFVVTGTIDMVNYVIEPADMVLEYDAATGNYKTEQQIILADGPDGLNFYDFFSGIVLEKGPDVTFTNEVIDEQPEGKVKVYQRKGKGFFADRGMVFQTIQDGGVMEITYAPDGKTVYMKNPISQVYEDTWVKGTLEGNRISVPALQCLAYDESLDYGVITVQLEAVEKVDEASGETYLTYEPNFEVGEFSFVVDDAKGVVTLENLTEESKIYGCVMSDNFMWPGYGDYASVYEPFDKEYSVMPEGVEATPWAFKYNDGYKAYSRLVNVGIAGDKIYVDGLSIYDEEAVISGTVSGDKVVFPSGQYLGRSADVLLFFTAAKPSIKIETDEYGDYEVPVYTYLPELTLTMDAAQRVMTVDKEQCLVTYCGDTYATVAELDYYMEACLDVQFRKFVEQAAKPANPVIENYDDSYWDWFGCSWISMTIPNEDVEGNYIAPEQMAYQLFVKTGDEKSVYTFYADEYAELDEDMTVLPYTFTDDMDIMPRGENIALYQTGFDDIGVQSINYTGGRETRSDIVWYKGGVEAGIEAAEAVEKAVKCVRYYRLDGTRLAAPEKGFCVKTVHYEDGTVQSVKMFCK